MRKYKPHFVPMSAPFDFVDYAMPSRQYPYTVVCYPQDDREPYSIFERCCDAPTAMRTISNWKEEFPDCLVFMVRGHNSN